MHVLEVGKPFTLFDSTPHMFTDGSIMEQLEDGSLALVVYFNQMSKEEQFILRESNSIFIRVFREGDFLITMIRYGNTPLIFESSFDPSLYKKFQMDKLMESNMLSIYGVDSSNNILKTIRYSNISKRLHALWITLWSKAIQTEGYSKKYERWCNDIDSRYSILELWDRAEDYGMLGE